MVELAKAFSSDRRLLVLEWLKDPTAHFPPQVDGDLMKDGVCAVFIAEKPRCAAQPTAGEHLKILSRVRPGHRHSQEAVDVLSPGRAPHPRGEAIVERAIDGGDRMSGSLRRHPRQSSSPDPWMAACAGQKQANIGLLFQPKRTAGLLIGTSAALTARPGHA